MGLCQRNFRVQIGNQSDQALNSVLSFPTVVLKNIYKKMLT